MQQYTPVPSCRRPFWPNFSQIVGCLWGGGTQDMLVIVALPDHHGCALHCKVCSCSAFLLADEDLCRRGPSESWERVPAPLSGHVARHLLPLAQLSLWRQSRPDQWCHLTTTRSSTPRSRRPSRSSASLNFSPGQLHCLCHGLQQSILVHCGDMAQWTCQD